MSGRMRSRGAARSEPHGRRGRSSCTGAAATSWMATTRCALASAHPPDREFRVPVRAWRRYPLAGRDVSILICVPPPAGAIRYHRQGRIPNARAGAHSGTSTCVATVHWCAGMGCCRTRITPVRSGTLRRMRACACAPSTVPSSRLRESSTAPILSIAASGSACMKVLIVASGALRSCRAVDCAHAHRCAGLADALRGYVRSLPAVSGALSSRPQWCSFKGIPSTRLTPE